MKPQTIEITPKTVVFAVLFVLSLQLIWLLKDLVFSLLIAFIIVSALKPIVEFLVTKRIPRTIAAIIAYVLFLFGIGYIFGLIIPSLVSEVVHFSRMLPAILQSFSNNFPTLFPLNSLIQYVPNVTTQAFDLVKGIFSNALFVISTLFFGFYMLVEENLIKKLLSRFLDEKKLNIITGIVEKTEKRMNAWFWGEITLMTVIGVMTFVGLNIIGMKYVLALSVLAGLLEVIPNIGPVTSLVPAFLIGISESYFMGFAMIALYFIIQQLENNVIVPMIMRRAVGLNPIVTLISLIIGGKLAGVLGILLAVPATLLLDTVLLETMRIRKLNS
jgi:predicted PurR-regulated permease PerM